MKTIAEWEVQRKIPYNVGLLLSLAFFYPTRNVWDKLGWMPFEKSAKEVCSTFVAELFKAWPVNLDILPGVETNLIAPGDYVNSPIF